MAPRTNSGIAIASMVLSIVGRISCFWGLQITARYGDADVATMQSLPQGDTFCATSV